MKTEDYDLEVEVKKIIAKIIEVDPNRITADALFVEDFGADSMMALEIMASIEKKYGITIPEEHLTKMSSLSQVIKLVNSLQPRKPK